MQTGLETLRRALLADPALQARLALLDRDDLFAAEASRIAQSQGVTLSPAEIDDSLRGPFTPPVLEHPLLGPLDGWIPVSLMPGPGGPVVQWRFIGIKPFTEPFFEGEIRRLTWMPLNRFLTRHTTMQAVEELAATLPVQAPAGFIFHMSRSGSTLMGRMLSAIPGVLVLSEPAPLDFVLRLGSFYANVPDTLRMAWTKALAAVMGRPRAGTEKAFVIKFDCWNIFDLDLLKQIWPDTPWVFSHRSPVEIMVSQQRQRGSQMLPGMMGWTPPGVTFEQASAMDLDDYATTVLASVTAFAVEAVPRHDGLLIDYRDMPAAGVDQLPAHFGFDLTPAEREAVVAISRANAKRPNEAFTSDTAEKRAEASPELIQLCAEVCDPPYAALLALRPG